MKDFGNENDMYHDLIANGLVSKEALKEALLQVNKNLESYERMEVREKRKRVIKKLLKDNE